MTINQIRKLYQDKTNQELAAAATYCAERADSAPIYQKHWIAIEDIIETRK